MTDSIKLLILVGSPRSRPLSQSRRSDRDSIPSGWLSRQRLAFGNNHSVIDLAPAGEPL